MSSGKRKKHERGSSSDGDDNYFRKGPWSPEEDAMLMEYVEKNGEGNWNAVHKNSGLKRSGRSCCMRWSSHLSPNLIKGPFTQEEEQKIVELHAVLGNKWAEIAKLLPGRSNYEIKDFWKSRKRRMQAADQKPVNVTDVPLQTHTTASGQESRNLDDEQQSGSTPSPDAGSELPAESETLLDDVVGGFHSAFDELMDYASRKIIDPFASDAAPEIVNQATAPSAKEVEVPDEMFVDGCEFNEQQLDELLEYISITDSNKRCSPAKEMQRCFSQASMVDVDYI